MTYLEANALDILFKTLLESENAGELPDEILDKIDANKEELDLDVEDIETTKRVFISQLGHVITRPGGKKDIILSNKKEKEAFLEALGAFMQEKVDHEVIKFTEEEFKTLKEISGFNDDILAGIEEILVEKPVKLNLEVKPERKVRKSRKSTNNKGE